MSQHVECAPSEPPTLPRMNTSSSAQIPRFSEFQEGIKALEQMRAEGAVIEALVELDKNGKEKFRIREHVLDDANATDLKDYNTGIHFFIFDDTNTVSDEVLQGNIELFKTGEHYRLSRHINKHKIVPREGTYFVRDGVFAEMPEGTEEKEDVQLLFKAFARKVDTIREAASFLTKTLAGKLQYEVYDSKVRELAERSNINAALLHEWAMSYVRGIYWKIGVRRLAQDGIHIFTAHWCQHCTNLKNTARDLFRRYECFEHENISSMYENYLKKENLVFTGVPTIVFIKKGKNTVEYNGERTSEAILKAYLEF